MLWFLLKYFSGKVKRKTCVVNGPQFLFVGFGPLQSLFDRYMEHVEFQVGFQLNCVSIFSF